jgi:AraC-like DNA-binding protein
MKVPDSEIQIHLDCYTYCKNKEKPLIEIKHFRKGTVQQLVTFSNEIVAIYKGTLNYSFGQTLNKQATEGAITMLPAKRNWMFEAVEDVSIIIFRLDIALSFCDHLSFEMLNREKKREKNQEKMHFLYANDVIIEYFTHLMRLLSDGLYCGYLLNIKLKELLYLLRYYYCMQELNAFFASVLSDDLEFSILVMKAYNPKLTVNDLAKEMHYSLSGFEKRFKKVFDTSPSQWLRTQRMQAIYHEINCSSKTISELGYEFGFSSPSHFNNFCKKVFNCTPGSLRKKG